MPRSTTAPRSSAPSCTSAISPTRPTRWSSPADSRPSSRLGLPTGYVIATDDRTIEPQIQRGFAERLPGAILAEVVAGHDCMVTRPDEVAAALEQVTRAW